MVENIVTFNVTGALLNLKKSLKNKNKVLLLGAGFTETQQRTQQLLLEAHK